MRLSANRHSTENVTITPKKKTLDGSYSSVPKTALSEDQRTYIHAIRHECKHSHKEVDLSYRSLKPRFDLDASMMYSGTGLLRTEKKADRKRSHGRNGFCYISNKPGSNPSDFYLVPLCRGRGAPAMQGGRQLTDYPWGMELARQ